MNKQSVCRNKEVTRGLLQQGPLSGQLPPDKESASGGPEAHRGARPEVTIAPKLARAPSDGHR